MLTMILSGDKGVKDLWNVWGNKGIVWSPALSICFSLETSFGVALRLAPSADRLLVVLREENTLSTSSGVTVDHRLGRVDSMSLSEETRLVAKECFESWHQRVEVA